MAKRKQRAASKKTGRGCIILLVVAFVAVAGLFSNGNKSTPRSQPTPRDQATATERGAKPAPSATANATDMPIVPAAPTKVPTVANEARTAPNVQVTPLPNVPLMYVMQTANARSCPAINCEILFTLDKGETFGADAIVVSDAVNGNRQWYQTKLGLNRQIAYIHSSLAVNYDSIAQPQQQPVQQSQPVQAPAPAQSFTCPSNCDGAVSMGLSAQQAAQCPGLDRDHDGVACYGD